MARQGGALTGNTPDETRQELPADFAVTLRASRLALFWERLWPALYPAGMVLAVFLILVGFDIWRYTPVWLHWTILAGFILLLGGSLWLGLRGFRLPDDGAALRRLETGNHLAHRPLSHLSDTLAAGRNDPIAEALWLAHRRRLLQRMGQVRVGWPVAGWWRIDRWGLRVALGLLLVVAWASPGEELLRRLEDAVKPGTALPPSVLMTLDAWIAPPLYTGRAPLFLGRDGKPVQTVGLNNGQASAEPLQVPTGSALKLRLQADRAELYSVKLGNRQLPLKALDQANGELDLEINRAETGQAAHLVLLRRDAPVADWSLQILPDLPPSISFAEPAKTDNRDRRRPQLELSAQGSDDYGLQKLDIEMTHPASSEVWLLDWAAPPALAGAFTDKRSFDFIEHPLAGQEVTLRLIATDAIGQTGTSETIVATLPARRFTHPVAKAVIEQRRDLALRPNDHPRVAKALRALSLAPESYREDTAVHLALRMAAARLGLDRSAKGRESVYALLWQAALRIEDGRSNLAERDFQSAYDRLQDAFDREADDPEIQRRIQELREAMERLLEEKMREAMERMARGEELEEIPEDQEAMNMDDFQDMMDQAEQMARQGERQSAQDMLEQMQRMLDAMKNMRIGRAPQGRQQQQGRQQGQRGMNGQQMQELGEMMRQQQQLLDRSFRRGQQQGRGQQGQPGQGQNQGESEADARQQEELRRRLGEMMNRLAERGMPIPDALGRADRAMRDAREALRGNDQNGAMQGQNDAMDQLRQGMQDFQQAGRGNPQGQAEAADNRQNQRNRSQRDPFGRTNNMDAPNSAEQVPGMDSLEGSALDRTRRILEELQRRAGNRERPTIERDYLERLLRRF